MKITYESQRLSLRFFLLMLILFAGQVAYGMLLAVQQVDPTILAGTLSFNVVRASHLSLGILWIICGFIGATVFVAPLLSKREIASQWLVKLLFYALIILAIWNISTQTLAMQGIAGWWKGQPWLQNGLEYLEGGRVFGIGVLVGFLIFAFVVLRTFPNFRKWNEIHWGLGLGISALAVVWVFGLFYISRIDLQEYFRWYVVHYWVEGVWEVIHISLVGVLIVIMFKASVRAVGFAVFWGISFVWLSGLIGNAHHYFWIGTPEFWQFWGSFFSALEPLPLIFCFWHIYLDAHVNKRPLDNAPAFYFLLGSTILELVGAGILGFTMTFALTNAWSHGTWITAGHGHLALFGTFGMLGIGAAYWAVAAIRNVPDFDQRIGRFGFWLLFIGMLGMAMSFAFGGVAHSFVARVLGLEWTSGDIGPAMSTFKLILPIFGFVFTVGALVIVYDLLTLGTHKAQPFEVPSATGWRKAMTGFEAGTWLLFMCFFGLVITFGLLAFNLPIVREEGDPTLPYLLSAVGYTGLFAATIAFVARFTASLDSRLRTTYPEIATPDLAVET
ncbi:cbb3-type cytochrome c oxidase subunit I [Aliidiomarina quisquiliarum]|uniref:cbb3-type cytochrome c oxidase subunit I n=1 Tax=Aliidiomarina quisquiliarum TaxID=2938947 RepID=UPI00208E5659|nr:cbb3-type cytochrome c oxidase subunit I [Aliidiomarina quisquiliarum]MCO4320043.1 cbb3-type cytochrome c oxidase subunit I [Aliidiomarina quisquiliarum]